MNKELAVICDEQLSAIHGGHRHGEEASGPFGYFIQAGDSIHAYKEIKWLINHIVDLYNGNVDEKDHFTRFFIDCKNEVVSWFS